MMLNLNQEDRPSGELVQEFADDTPPEPEGWSRFKEQNPHPPLSED